VLKGFMLWIESTPLATAITDSIWIFPAAQCIHLLALCVIAGAVFIVDFRLLGFGLLNQSANQLSSDLQPFLNWALALMASSGLLMFISEAVKLYSSPVFRNKMILLLVSIIFTFFLKNRYLAKKVNKLFVRKALGFVSLALWIAVGISGRWIGFY